MLLSSEAAGMLSTGTTVLLADGEGGAGSKATDGLLAKGDDTFSRRVDDGFDTAARFLDSRNLRVSFRIGMSENLGDFSAWKCIEIEISKIQKKTISKRKITSVQTWPLSSPDVLEQAICKKRKSSMKFFSLVIRKWEYSIEWRTTE